MMLDQKQAFDEVVARHAKDPAAVKRILANPVYAQISGSLAGAQEYAAMAKLHDFDRDRRLGPDRRRHAADRARARLPRCAAEADRGDRLAGDRVVPQAAGRRRLAAGRWSARPARSCSSASRSSSARKFIDDLGVFFTEFNDILGGFRKRAEETFALLRQPRVGFVLVASPEPMAVREALAFHERLRRPAMPFVGFVVNKVHAAAARSPATRAPRSSAALAAQPAVAALGLSGTTLHDGRAGAARRARRARDARRGRPRRRSTQLRAAGGDDARRSSRCRSCATTSTTSSASSNLGQFLAPPIAERATA